MFSNLRRSWSFNFIRKHWHYMSLSSAFRFRNVVLRHEAGSANKSKLVQLRVRQPFAADICLREAGTDRSTLGEIVIQEIYQRAATRVRTCHYVMDLGANIGLAALYFAQQFPLCRVYCVEPSKDNFRLLSMNVKSHTAKKRIQVCHAAVWSENATVAVGVPPDGTGFDAITVSTARPLSLQNVVVGYTMETLLAQSGFPHVDILKIDIEGSEAELFHGDASWLQRVNAITIEFHGDCRERSNFDSVMKANGFHVEDDTYPNTVFAVRPAADRQTL